MDNPELGVYDIFGLTISSQPMIIEKMRFIRLGCISLLGLLLLACTPKGPKLEPLDLLQEGIPFTIHAPAGVETAVNDLGIMKDVTVKNHDGYSLQIFESEATQLDPKKVIEALRSDIQQSEFFSKLISEDPTGFVFEKKVGDDYTNYDFRHVKIRGDKQYIMQAGLAATSTLEQAQTMYQSVQ